MCIRDRVGFDIPPDEILLPLIIEAYREANVLTRVQTAYDMPLLGGVGYADPNPVTQHPHIVTASQQVNTPEWHHKVLSCFPPA